MKIEPIPTTYRKLITSQFLLIPHFQRPYSWTIENVEEFWDDLISAKGKDYFVGSVVLYRHSKDPAAVYITDGQQRLTTLTILLCAIRDLCDTVELKSIANGLHNLIERKDEDDKKRFLLRYESINKYFANFILSRNSEDGQPGTDEEKTQHRAYKFLKSKLEKYLEVTLGTEWANSEKLLKTISEIRQTVLGLDFISLTLDNEDDAYMVFETLNSRGKDLEVSDLLKNLFSRFLKTKASNKDLSPVSDSWNEIRGRFEGISAKVNFDAFLLHYWLSREKYVSKKKLFKEMKKTILKPQAKIWLKDIVSASDAYAHIAAPGEYDWSTQEFKLRDSLDAINRFGVMQARPLLISIIRAHLENDSIKIKQIKTALKYVENFTFQFNAITQSRGGGGISNMYSKLATSCSKIKSAQDFTDFVDDVLEKFRERDIDKEEFEFNFQQLEYSKKVPKDRLLVRYILQKFHQSYAKVTVADYSLFSIEHLNPQSGDLEHQDYGNIGNLLFIPEELNNELRNKEFNKKKDVILQEGHDLNLIENWAGGTREEISQRAKQLATYAYTKIWKL